MKDDFENIEIDNSDDFAEELTEPSVPSSDFNESGTSGIEESGSSFASETNSDVPNVSDADIERLNDSKNKNYTKADSGKEAFDRKVNNKNYYKDELNNAKDRKATAKNNLKKASDNKDQTKDRLNQARQRRNSIPRGQRTSSDKEEYKNAKSEAKEAKANEKKEKNNLKDAKKDIFNAKKDNLKSKAYQARHPIEAAKNTAEAAVKTAAKKVAKKILLAIAPYAAGLILGLALAFFVIELILGPLMEVWGNIDEAITKTADFSEKLTNFYNGFGFQDSKEAFYDELDDLCDRYGCSNDETGMDVPLILATLFYTEGMGYDTEYGEMDDDSVLDGSSIGSNSGSQNVVKEYLREKYDMSKETVGEDGLTYNVGKIYRLRKLARNQFYTNSFGLSERKGPTKTVSLSDFLDEYGSNIANDVKDMLSDFVAYTFTSILLPFNEIYADAIGSKYSGEYFQNLSLIGGDFVDTFKVLVSDIFYGIADITDVDVSLTGIKVTYRQFAFDEENYKNYLMNYYFERMPEFRSMLGGLAGDARTEKKEYLYKDIVSNKNLFKDIFLQYADADSESYIDSCFGAIDVNLVSELQKPVNIPDGTTVSFSDQYAYGVVDGKYHNGVDLNETTAAVSLGSNVYSVANGTIESISNLSGCTANSENVCAKTIKISHNIVIDSSEYKFSTIYTNIISKEGLSINSNINKGDILGTIASTNNDEGLHFSFMDNKESSSGTIIDPTNLFITCSTSADDWKIHNIVLSKNDFKNKLQSYCSRVGCGSSMQLFVNNSDLIYDTAKRNNVNPELVVVRAVNEGFSPGGGSNNYWGIGCTNTGGVNACSRYSSLSDGVKGFASISPVKNSETASEMMSTYAYIGDYWYNPGSWSLGGCAYYPSINGYMSSSRSVTVGGYCETSRGCSGSSCNKTIDEDQQAYSKWQVEENLIKRRKEIFGY